MKFLEVVVVVVDKDVDEGEYAVVVQNVVLYLDHLSKMIFGVADGKVMVVMVVNFFPRSRVRGEYSPLPLGERGAICRLLGRTLRPCAVECLQMVRGDAAGASLHAAHVHRRRVEDRLACLCGDRAAGWIESHQAFSADEQRQHAVAQSRRREV